MLSLESLRRGVLSSSKNAGVAVVYEPVKLSCLAKGNMAAVIWRRNMHRGLRSWLDNIPVDQLPRGRIILPVPMVQSAVSEMMDIHGMPDCLNRRFLLEDVCLLASVFSKLCPSRYLSCVEGFDSGTLSKL